MPALQRQTLRIGHSPDPDDAFMWYPLANFPDGTGPGGKSYTPTIDTGPYDFVHVLEDIQSLNDRSEKGELEITAISIHQYPYIADKYAMTSCGSSMGDGYGPMIVVPESSRLRLSDLDGAHIAIPGLRTSAYLALSLLLKKKPAKVSVVMFDEIIPQVAAGKFDAGLIIHEGQLTYADTGLKSLIDLGKWWTETRGLPMPLGGNAIRRDLGQPAMGKICTVLLNSIKYALEHRDAAVDYAMNYARDMGKELADQFVGMYVNKWTLDYGRRGREAVKMFLREAVVAGLVPECGEVDFVEPA
ncbi:MAG: MqnA/MqnD/SBP family protein [Phycisphaeraceae bacterium]